MMGHVYNQYRYIFLWETCKGELCKLLEGFHKNKPCLKRPLFSKPSVRAKNYLLESYIILDTWIDLAKQEWSYLFLSDMNTFIALWQLNYMEFCTCAWIAGGCYMHKSVRINKMEKNAIILFLLQKHFQNYEHLL